MAINPLAEPAASDQADLDDVRRTLAAPLVAANDLKALAAVQLGSAGLVVTSRELEAVRVPALGIIGSADRAAGTMRELGTMMPALNVVTVEGAEHGGERGILRRREFIATLRPFLDAHTTRP